MPIPHNAPEVKPVASDHPGDSPQVGDRIIQYLEQLGVEYVFGVPGGAIEPLYNALARSARRGGPRAVVARHETGAAFMADGYARETGRLGVCCATTGPGATNLITGVCAAYENEIPLLVLTAQTPLHTFGRAAFQESSCTGVDTVSMFRHCTRYNSLVSHPVQLEHKLVAAVLAAHRRPRGPVHLSIPLDVLRSPATAARPLPDLPALLRAPRSVDLAALDLLYGEVTRAHRMVFVVGQGCGAAVGTILELALLLDVPVVTTPDGKGLVSPYHPQFRGVFGFAGHASATEVLTGPGVGRVLAIGTSLGEWTTGAWDQEALLNGRLIHIDDTPEHFARSPMAVLHVEGDIAALFERLLARVAHQHQGATDPWMRPDSFHPVVLQDRHEPHLLPLGQGISPHGFVMDDAPKCMDERSPIKPQRLMRDLAQRFPPATRFLADTGNSVPWAVHYLHPMDRRMAGQRSAQGGFFRVCMEFAPMGWAIGAAVGTALGRPGVPVVCITGDGSLLMNGQELTVAVAERLPVVFVVLNDGALGMVKHGQRLSGAEAVGYELPPVDFCAMARAMGAAAHTIRLPRDLSGIDVDEACRRHGPTVLDVHVDPDEIPPIHTRMKVLRSAR
ncbi:MAG: acetolactate synthase [Chromatiales bacterium 21-64-14]|nr:MAG: acetolactate synthase [Chromatiales bacterium 21-64-14]HQU15586.1 thiamine pyrophosphate-binding protein [Gammaproteobacteria bacterium]